MSIISYMAQRVELMLAALHRRREGEDEDMTGI